MNIFDRSLSEAEELVIERSQLDERTSMITVEGDLDLGNAPQLKWTLVQWAQMGSTQLVLDFSRVGFIDSTALGVLVGIERLVAPQGRLAIACPQDAVLRTFAITGLDRALPSFSTREAALDFVRRTVAGP